ncbi:hypothetical protein LNTAR_06204 [Lentisphaera araneosa HTCC2155]|jgi:hypothetical protein|uniref:Knr4/Smi1-like domain-containing protein n=1 Tax=Lentisphaera araneosa HTCC2155 TaxID=313628 RepID=A6DN67_9BACT|nr:SMI1/KNR4 family protein [Lentisphaera araneosa]EDM26815.1 hypothetical protein LNTAR_06204 [Lentisphaera araneosa HTCC2155]
MNIYRKNHAFKEYENPIVTQKDISVFEKKYNIKLPKKYKEILLIQNGGTVEIPIFKLKSKKHHIDSIYGINESKSEYVLTNVNLYHDEKYSLYFTRSKFKKENLDPNKILIFYTDYDNFYALDYNNNQEPEVIWFKVGASSFNQKKVIANNFEDFLNLQFHGSKLSFSKNKKTGETLIFKDEISSIDDYNNTFTINSQVYDHNDYYRVITEENRSWKNWINEEIIQKNDLITSSCFISLCENSKTKIYKLTLESKKIQIKIKSSLVLSNGMFINEPSSEIAYLEIFSQLKENLQLVQKSIKEIQKP